MHATAGTSSDCSARVLLQHKHIHRLNLSYSIEYEGKRSAFTRKCGTVKEDSMKYESGTSDIGYTVRITDLMLHEDLDVKYFSPLLLGV